MTSAPRRHSIRIVVTMLAMTGAALTLAAQSATDPVATANAEGWQVPDSASQLRSATEPTPSILGSGKQLYGKYCQQCHGTAGKGDGPFGDPSRRPADLTASTTPDGVMYYKVWNGRKAPSMPAFKGVMTRDDIWAAIAYAKSLRAMRD